MNGMKLEEKSRNEMMRKRGRNWGMERKGASQELMYATEINGKGPRKKLMEETKIKL